MNPLSIVLAAVLLVATCDVTSGQGSLASRRRFFSRVVGTPQATCDWVKNPSKLKELRWKEQVDLCFESGPQYAYPTQDVAIALQNDPAANEFLNYLVQCYNYGDQSYYNPWNQKFYTQDLCPVRPRPVEMVWRWNHIDRKQDHCYIVKPEVQRVHMAQCGDGSNHPDSQKCKRDEYSYFQGNYYCIPDGYVQRTVLVYCPWDPEVQCIPAQVRIPTGCSCKQYTCDKFRASAAGSFAGLGSLTARLHG
nr:hypothetical protein BaRGS_009314 [Batillaria attramentaria]